MAERAGDTERPPRGDGEPRAQRDHWHVHLDPDSPLVRELERLSPTGHIETVDATALLEPEPHWFNVPNGLTFLRALLVPVILWLLGQDGVAARWWAFGIFVFAAATDSIDGWVARRWHGITRWGQLADPIADKLLIVGSLASLAAVGDLPWWAVWVTVVREVAVTGLRLVLVRRLSLVMPASHWGKAKTISQVVAVALYLSPQVGEALALRVLYVAIGLTIWSGIDYAFRAGRLARHQRMISGWKERVR